MYKYLKICAWHCAIDGNGTIVFRTISKKRCVEWLDINNETVYANEDQLAEMLK